MIDRFEQLLGEYWETAFDEAVRHVNRGDDANRVLHALRAFKEDAERYHFLRQRLTGEEFERITNRWPMSNEEADTTVDEMIAKLQGEK